MLNDIKKIKVLNESNMSNKENAPSFAYRTLYGKSTYLQGRTNSPKKMWKGLDVDADLKDKWLKSINDLPVEIRSTDAGKSEERPAFVIFRLKEDDDKRAKEISKLLNNEKDISSLCDKGNMGRSRISVVGPYWKGKKGWENWWDTVSDKINSAYSSTLNEAVLTEATKPMNKAKRKKMEELIYNTFDILDKKKVNSTKYRKLFNTMTDEKFDKWFQRFFR